jgi:FMN-dependent NADH-azoreductase
MSSLHILRVQASPRGTSSVSRDLGDTLIAELSAKFGAAKVTARDVSGGVAAVTPEWIGGAYTKPADRTPAQTKALALSDTLVAELVANNTLIIEAPMYNFTVPATLKSWIDQVCRAGVSFQVGPEGFKGLLANRPTYVIVTTGGVPLGSPYDFTTPYMRHILGFIGITDVTFIDAAQLNSDGTKPAAAVAAIKKAVAHAGKLAA